MIRFDNHTHSEYSNSSLGFPDCTNKLKDLIQRAYDIGLAGINISDHECLSSSVQALEYYNSMSKDRDFKISIGNEIYLLTEQEYFDNKEKATHPYYHFVLTALDTEGYKQLCRLSDRAWQRAWKSFIWRRPTLYNDLYDIIKPNQGHVVASSACLGGRIDKHLLENNINQAIKEVETFQDIFGINNFYLEVQPSAEIGNDQSISNERMKQVIKATGCKCIATTDAHYLRKEDRVVHKAYLNSGDGDRETDEFYASAYLMDNDELREYLHHEFNDKQIDWFFKNSMEIYNRIQEYDIFHNPIIPLIPEDKIPQFAIKHYFKEYYNDRPNFKYYAYRDNIHEQFFFYQLEQGLMKHIVNTNKKDNLVQYLDRIELELKELKDISEILDTKMACYYSTMSQIINLCWETGSFVGVSRGSALGYVINYLLEITQIDPLPYGEYTPYWRHLSSERGAELPDIDTDSEPIAKYKIIEAMKDYFGYDKTLQVIAFSKISSKTAIEKACRGLGVSLEDANFMKSLIPVNRGKVAKLKDCLYGDNKISELYNSMSKFVGLSETALALEGLITNRSVHAAGVTICNEPYTDYLSMMRSADGEAITNMNLADSEAVSLVKFDMLTVGAIQKIHKCVDFCIENGLMEWQGSLKATYDKYLHPDVINYDNQEMWAMIPKIFSVFQFDTPISQKVLARIKPNNLYDLSESNSIMRLAPEGMDETPLDIYCRYKNNIQEFFDDCKNYGLTEEEANIVHGILKESYGVCGSQENLMRLSMHDKVSGFGLKEANKLRKAIAKKDEDLQAQVKELFYEKGLERGTRKLFLDYVWNKQFIMQKG